MSQFWRQIHCQSQASIGIAIDRGTVFAALAGGFSYLHKGKESGDFGASFHGMS
jgi:hypothetical protein